MTGAELLNLDRDGLAVHVATLTDDDADRLLGEAEALLVRRFRAVLRRLPARLVVDQPDELPPLDDRAAASLLVLLQHLAAVDVDDVTDLGCVRPVGAGDAASDGRTRSTSTTPGAPNSKGGHGEG